MFVKGTEPQIALADDGRFAIAYSCPDSRSDPDTNDDGLFVQRFNPDGTFLGTRLWVTGQTTGQKQARLAMLGDGRMVVAWNETNGVAKLRYYDWNAPSEAIPYGPYVRESVARGRGLVPVGERPRDLRSNHRCGNLHHGRCDDF